MVGELLAIAAIYGSGICLVHLLYSRLFRREKAFHIVMMTNHAGSSIEWHLRSIAFMSLLGARNTVVTVLDEGSTDETVRIAERLANGSRWHWKVVAASSHEEAETWLKQAQGVDRVIRISDLLASGENGGPGPAANAAPSP
jgi:hypothetical protein